MLDSVAAKHARIRQVLRLERPDRLPWGDTVTVEYRPHVYHLGEHEPVPDAGVVGVTRDGRRKVTRDGGVWPVDAREKYPSHEEVLAVDLERFEVETVGPAMLGEMTRLLTAKATGGFPVPWHYATLITRAVIEFGWEPFLMAAALDPARFDAILERFGRASLAVAEGWARTAGADLIVIHDDIAGTRGLFLSPAWYRRHAFPRYEPIFAEVRSRGRKVLYISDGDYRAVLGDLLALGVDGLYVESSSMGPAEFLPLAGTDKLYLIKTDSRAMDFGTPDDIRRELEVLRELHRDYPGMMIYPGGGNPPPANREAFARWYRELLVYD